MANILTRREARQQAKQNRGYNRGQFQLAMANAKNALRDNSDLRGRELRQTARRMVAGTGEYAQSNLPSTFEEWINSPVLAGRPSSGGAEAARAAVQRGISKANRIGVVTPIVNPDTNFSGLAGGLQQETPTADLTEVGSFDNAFALARKNGMKVFTWNGKKYGTKMDPNWRERWGRVESQNQPNNEVNVKMPDLNSALVAANNDITSQIDNDIAAQEYEGIRKVVRNNLKLVMESAKNNLINTINNLKFVTEPATNNIINTNNNRNTETLKPIVTANPRKNIDLNRKQLMDRWRYILANQSEYSPREIQYAKENLPLYQKRFGNTYE
ncbi:MAG: hypothetical protein MR405_01660 [Mollicutes bacterium]|nr:hypothetical protein [Mollicutes bacterium]